MARPPRDNNGPGGKGGSGDKEKILDDMNDPTMRQLARIRAQNGGWTEKPPEDHKDYPLVTTKRALLEGIRHHIMRLNTAKGDSSKAKGEVDLDVTNQDQFPRPVTLLRRDPRLPPAYRMAVKEEPTPMDPADAAEFERVRQLKAEREAQRALDQAQIAPVARSNEPKPKQSNKKEKPTAFYGRNSDAQKKESKIHYEETWPWHLEDAEGKAGVWVGSYVASLSDLHVALVIDGARFRMIPLERYYRFDEKPKFDTLSLDDAEKMMYEVKEIKRWVMKQKDQELAEREKNETRQFLRGPTRVKTESATSRMARRTERQDDFELDFEGDEFQDDDEAPGFEADDDEDAKAAKDRIRREQVSANTFGEGEEDKVEQQEREEQLEKLRAKMIGKQTVKTLKKLEHGLDYDDLESGSEENNPFTDESVSAAAVSLGGLHSLIRLRIRKTSRRIMQTERMRKAERSRALPGRIQRATPRLLAGRKSSTHSRRASSSVPAPPTCLSRATTRPLARSSRRARGPSCPAAEARPSLGGRSLWALP
jgi:transcription initiation factor TFIIF subunit alpha